MKYMTRSVILTLAIFTGAISGIFLAQFLRKNKCEGAGGEFLDWGGCLMEVEKLQVIELNTTDIAIIVGTGLTLCILTALVLIRFYGFKKFSKNQEQENTTL